MLAKAAVATNAAIILDVACATIILDIAFIAHPPNNASLTAPQILSL
jgi:hypothetical protein